MTNLLDYNLSELQEIMASYNQPKFRAKQLYQAMLSGKDYGDDINLPKNFLSRLEENGVVLQPVKIYKEKKSKDKTVKFLYKVDGDIIEGVLMNYKFGNTICVSTQIGCKMNCKFCASSINGFVRNLTVGEILGQIVAVNKYLGGNFKDRKITNIVLMGSGEPMDNYANVIKFLRAITDENGFNFSVRNISVSTCGIPHKIEELADTGMSVTLSISLHAPNNTIRREIMPIANKYSIEEVVEAAKHYNLVTNRRIIFEYTLIDGVNNKATHARQLADLLRDIPCHVNLIKLNEVDGRDLKTPSMISCENFLGMLNRFGISATLRRTMGDDVEGACGQLRNRELMENGKLKESSYKTHEKSKKNIVKDNQTKRNNSKTTKKDATSFDRKRTTQSRKDKNFSDDKQSSKKGQFNTKIKEKTAKSSNKDSGKKIFNQQGKRR